jgi:hypothetical protein
VRDQLHGQAASPLGKYAPASIGGWVVPRATLGTLGKTNFLPLPGIETRFPRCPPRSLFSIRPAISRLREWQKYRAVDSVGGFRRSLFWFRRAGNGRSRWPRRLRRESGAARLLGLRVWISPEAWMSVSCECCVFCQVEVSATERFLVQRSPNECSVCVCVCYCDLGQQKLTLTMSK